jgi:hypothetical protein
MSPFDRSSDGLKNLWRAIVLGASMTLACVAPALATVLIRDDSGGPVGGYMQRYAAIRDSGEDVVIDGQCLSACTLVLALVPRERICLTRQAVFGFHAAMAQQEWRYPGAANAATRVLWELYPEPVRKLIAERGGLSERMIYLGANELAKSFSLCRLD